MEVVDGGVACYIRTSQKGLGNKKFGEYIMVVELFFSYVPKKNF